ncbi:MAG TPA: XdhC family protein [Acidimicrobiia bacterium]|nr:XdhC family protein [Acidimicrobiia bacterium]
METPEVGRAVADWRRKGWAAAFARVTEVRGVGSAATGELFAVNDAGDRAGQLVGGAVTGAVAEATQRLLARPAGIEVLDLPIDDEGAHRAGLSCGGAVTVVAQNTDRIPAEFWTALAGREPVVLATTLEGEGGGALVVLDGETFGTLGQLDGPVGDAARDLLAGGDTTSRQAEIEGQRVLLDAFVPDPHLVIVGGGVLAGAVADQARVLGWPAEIAADLEAACAGLDRGGAAAALVLLSHTPAIDAPVLAEAIRRRVRYLGALGSARTQRRRRERLGQLGIGDDDIDRIRGPIGLDLGSNRPAHIALAICAEVLAVRNRRDATALQGRTAPIRTTQPA